MFGKILTRNVVLYGIKENKRLNLDPKLVNQGVNKYLASMRR